mgnify:CR=1 FL=1
MDHAVIKRLQGTLEAIREQYADARVIVRDMRDREAPDTQTAYWLGVAQSFSKQAADDLSALADAIERIECCVRPVKPKL